MPNLQLGKTQNLKVKVDVIAKRTVERGWRVAIRADHHSAVDTYVIEESEKRLDVCHVDPPAVMLCVDCGQHVRSVQLLQNENINLPINAGTPTSDSHIEADIHAGIFAP